MEDEKKAEFNFTSQQREQLIDFVKSNEALYKVSHPEYKNTEKKDRLWLEIGTLLNKKGKFVF